MKLTHIVLVSITTLFLSLSTLADVLVIKNPFCYFAKVIFTDEEIFVLPGEGVTILSDKLPVQLVVANPFVKKEDYKFFASNKVFFPSEQKARQEEIFDKIQTKKYFILEKTGAFFIDRSSSNSIELTSIGSAR